VTRILSMDAATPWGGVALVESGSAGEPEVVAEAGLRSLNSHAPHLLALADALLAEAGWARTSLDGFAATRGPGSFTGLRVALGTVAGLALSASRPAFGIGTLAAMADHLGPAGGPRVPLLDARRGEVYGAVYDPLGSPPVEVVAPWLGSPERAIERLGAGAILFGSGATAYAARLAAAGWKDAPRRLPPGVAGAAGRLAMARLLGGAAGGEGMAPLYLRPADAEIKETGETKG
jgi:tRNA threonylcarbamoyladenosine biosynthesis protein TsaB